MNQKSLTQTNNTSANPVSSLTGLHFQEDLQRNNRAFSFIYKLELLFMNFSSEFKGKNKGWWKEFFGYFSLRKLNNKIKKVTGKAEDIRDEILNLHRCYAQLQVMMNELEAELQNLKQEILTESGETLKNE